MKIENCINLIRKTAFFIQIILCFICNDSLFEILNFMVMKNVNTILAIYTFNILKKEIIDKCFIILSLNHE